MTTPRAAQHRDLTEEIKILKRQVSQLMSAMLTRPTMGVGAGTDLVVKDGGRLIVKRPGDTNNALEFGARILSVGGVPTYGGTGLIARDDSDVEIAYFGSNPIGGERLSLRDAGGRQVVADDGYTGFGLAIPYLHFPLYTTPPQAPSTTGSAFATLWAGRIQYAGPWLRTIVSCYLTGATAGQVRLLLDGAVAAVADFTTTSEVTLEVSLYDQGKYPNTTGTVALQARVAGGSGSAGLIPRACHARQS